MRGDEINGQNVWVIERTRCLSFLFKPSETLFVGGKSSRQNLDCYLAIHLWIVSAIHFAHSAGANLRADFITVKPGACGKLFAHDLRLETELGNPQLRFPS